MVYRLKPTLSTPPVWSWRGEGLVQQWVDAQFVEDAKACIAITR